MNRHSFLKRVVIVLSGAVLADVALAQAQKKEDLKWETGEHTVTIPADPAVEGSKESKEVHLYRFRCLQYQAQVETSDAEAGDPFMQVLAANRTCEDRYKASADYVKDAEDDKYRSGSYEERIVEERIGQPPRVYLRAHPYEIDCEARPTPALRYHPLYQSAELEPVRKEMLLHGTNECFKAALASADACEKLLAEKTQGAPLTLQFNQECFNKRLETCKAADVESDPTLKRRCDEALSPESILKNELTKSDYHKCGNIPYYQGVSRAIAVDIQRAKAAAQKAASEAARLKVSKEQGDIARRERLVQEEKDQLKKRERLEARKRQLEAGLKETQGNCSIAFEGRGIKPEQGPAAAGTGAPAQAGAAKE